MAKLIIIVVSAHGVLHILFAKNFLASRSGGVASIVSRENLIALLALSSLQKFRLIMAKNPTNCPSDNEIFNSQAVELCVIC